MIYTLLRKVYQKAELNLLFDTIQKNKFRAKLVWSMMSIGRFQQNFVIFVPFFKVILLPALLLTSVFFSSNKMKQDIFLIVDLRLYLLSIYGIVSLIKGSWLIRSLQKNFLQSDFYDLTWVNSFIRTRIEFKLFECSPLSLISVTWV